jgi:hypothetical protein
MLWAYANPVPRVEADPLAAEIKSSHSILMTSLQSSGPIAIGNSMESTRHTKAAHAVVKEQTNAR